MKIIAFLLLASVALAAEPPYRLTVVNSVPTSPAARAILADINAAFLLLGPQPAEFWRGRTHTQNAQMREDAQQAIRRLAETFHREHPSDPLRWVAVQQMLMSPPSFITGYRPGFDEAAKPGSEFWIVDETARAAWTAKLQEYEAAMASATDVPWEVRERVQSLRLLREIGSAAREGPAAVGKAEKRIDALASAFPEGRAALSAYEGLYRTKFRDGGAPAEEIWGRLSASENRAVRERAEAELRKIDAERKPIEMTFTAVDGRVVDLAQLRGKVVLIDFWATWCGPCIAELPNVKKVYEAYHDRGFEIVGITLENPRFSANDTPQQQAEKLEAAKAKLKAFTAENAMPWPQYFDGTHWKNPIAKDYAVNGIPAMFLLDQNGRVVSTSVRGAKLETEVRRLLGM